MITKVVVLNPNDETDQFFCDVTGSLTNQPYHTLYPGDSDWDLIVDQINPPFGTFDYIGLYQTIAD